MRSAARAAAATCVLVLVVLVGSSLLPSDSQAAPLLKRLHASSIDSGLFGAAWGGQRSIKYVGLQAGAGQGQAGSSAIVTKPVEWLRLEGRFHASNDALYFEWPHSTIRARFEGESLAMRLDLVRGESDFYEVIIDKRPPVTVTVTAGQPSTKLAAGLGPGVHSVQVTKRTESHQSTAKFTGFDLGRGGKLLEAPPPKERRIEVIGDSISAGFGNECSGVADPEHLKTQNAFMTYAAMAARVFDADLRLTASAGRGVTKNADQTVEKTMPLLWDKVLPDYQPSLTWKFNGWQPHLVIVALSTNDWFGQAPDPVQFQLYWIALLARIRQVYPEAHIMVAIGPMLNHDTSVPGLACCLSTARHYILTTLQRATLDNLSTVEFPPETSLGLPLGCTAHPTVAIHEVMAQHLVPAVTNAMGWQPKAA